MTIAISPQTTAATYEIKIPDGQSRYYKGWGFSGADAITLQGMTTEDAFVDSVEGGTTITLSSTTTERRVNGPFIGRWSKGTTTGSVGMREQE